MSTNRSIAWNTLVQFIGKAISTFIGVIIIGIMTRYLGTEGFGLYSTANAYFQVFVLILDFGLNVTLVQMLGENTGNTLLENRLVRATFSLRLISAFFLLTTAAIIGWFLPYPLLLRLSFFAIWASFFATALNQIVIGVQQRHLRMHIVAIGEVVGRFILLIGILIAQYFNAGLIAIVAFVSLGSVCNFLINIFVARGYATFSFTVDIDMWKRILIRSWPIGISIFFNLIYYKADTLILAHFRSFTEVGLYGAAYRVLDILTTMPFMYMGVVLPILSYEWASKNQARFTSLLQNSYTIMALIAAPIIAATLAVSKPIMILVAGSTFAESGPILNILVFAAGIIFLGTVSSHAVVALHLQRDMLKYYIIVAILTLAGYCVFIPKYGVWAAAGLTVFSESCIALMTTIATIRRSKISLDYIPILKILFSALGMFICTNLLAAYPLYISLSAGCSIYTICILLSGVVSNDSLREILAIKKGSNTNIPI